MSASSTEATNLAGKTCLITGGAGGLGRALAAAFLRAGANVAICDINEERLKQASAELSGTGAGSLLAAKADVADPAAAQQLFDRITAKFRTVDVLVNNAAIMDRFDPVADLDLELWDRVISVNLAGPFIFSKLALRVMLQQPKPDGCILNIASGAAKGGWLAGAAYTTSKHGLVGLTKSTASFYGPKGIRCNALMVGPMQTEFGAAHRGSHHEEGSRKVMEILSGVGIQLCDVREVADLCVSLATGPGSSLINGACIAVDHGWTSVVG
ncbi:hypothetical protein B0J12DRAFT_577981 [Macrophomina phaseolina]|uniref:Short-chain dehydrogenase/reductase SDR n=1 Tax=Macrophomina phaseolina TaxID=35725 RepID=A0ABQ8G465_9PEZI|nr:hypothetical protein B0J12DRAFT_577981 [Macrophomina phaseolina]